MSLQVWLPLNGDLKNQGLSDVQVTTPTVATFDNTGKIGKCLLYNSKVSIPATQVASIFNNEHMSIAFWYNNNGGSTSSHSICGFQGNSEGDSGASRIYDFFQYSSKNDFHWSMGTLGGGVLNGVIPDNTWIHICVIYNSGNLKIYINGILNHDSSGHSSAYTFNKSYYINFGYGQKLNDFRIYDHALSVKEVKEIAKGLVLHYPLKGIGPSNMCNWGYSRTPNLPNTAGNTILSVTLNNDYARYTATTAGTNGGKYGYPCGSGNLIQGTVYTWSCEVRSSVAFTGNSRFRFGFEGGGMFVGSTFTCGTEWKKISKTWTQTTSQAFVCYPSGSFGNNEWIDIRNLKCEVGSVATSYIPNPADSFYALFSDSANIEYDCSGYERNGTKVGTIMATTNTPRYQSSYEFIDDCAQYIKGPLLDWINQTGFSMSCWFYKKTHEHTNGGTKALGHQFIFSQGRDWYSSSDTNYYGVSIVSNQNGGIWIPIANTSFTSTINIPLNTWAHVVLTYDGTTAKLYINGILNTSKAVDKSNLKWGNASNAIVIGKMAHNNVSDTTYFPFVGNISDFRVYATALSAADVKALYTDAGYVDKNGNFHAYEFVEI